jgi:hypothetical protein
MPSPDRKLVLIVDDTPTNVSVVSGVVCTENLNPDVVVMKSAKDRV